MIIYKITNTINNMSYIGATSMSLRSRWLAHTYKSGCKAIREAIQKFGKDNFTIVEIEKCSSKEEAYLLEEKYIKKHDSLFPNGYNLRHAGPNGKYCKDARERMRLSNRGKVRPGRKMSKETKLKISKLKMGQPGWNKGQKLSEEHKRNLSANHYSKKPGYIHPMKGKLVSLESRKKMSKSAKTKPPVSEETRKKLSISGKKAWEKRSHESL